MAKTLKPGRSRFHIEVLQEDIDKAQANNSSKCVVAQAVARIIPDATRIEIDLQSVRFTRAETGERFLYLTPNIAAGYVVAFDAGDEMHPFDFWLSNPVKIKRRVRTEAGNAVNNAVRKAKRAGGAPSAERAPEGSEEVPEENGAPSAERAPSASADDPSAVAAAVKEEFAAAKKSETVSGTHPSRPRTYKTGKRVYGSRILRVNRYLREETKA